MQLKAVLDQVVTDHGEALDTQRLGDTQPPTEINRNRLGADQNRSGGGAQSTSGGDQNMRRAATTTSLGQSWCRGGNRNGLGGGNRDGLGGEDSLN